MMNQSTSFAQVATNLLNVLQGYTKGIRFVVVLILLLTVGIGQAWAAEVTFTTAAYNGKGGASGEGGSATSTSSGVTITSTKAYYTSAHIREYSGGTITVSSSNNITKIVFTSTASGTNSNGPGKISLNSGGGSYSYSGTEGTWTGSSTSIKFDCDAQFRWTKIVVTTKDADPYTVTFHTTATKEEDIEEASAGAGVTPPTMEEECGEWEFQGWSELPSISETSTTELELVTLTNGIYYPTKDVNLYPVYIKTEGGGGSTTTTFTFSSIASANNWSNGNAYTPVVISPITITANGGGNNAKYYTSDKTWRMYNGGSLEITTSTGNITNVSSNPSYTFTITNGTATCTFSETTKFKSITVTSGGGFTTYYYSYPQCNTETTVTLNPNGGTGNVITETTEEKTYTVPDCPFTRTGYDFVKWNTQEDGKGTNYSVGSTINLDGTDVNLYAIWTPNEYEIIYKDQGNADFTGANEADLPDTHTYGQQTDLVDATKSGYNFLGWFTTSDCSGSAVDHLGATEYTGNITLYAKWEEIPTTCTVTYDANGGTGTAPTDNTEYTNGATVTVSGNFGKFTNKGYAFTGWNTKADGTGNAYKHNEKFTITTNTTLYAQWCEAYWKLVTDESELENDTRIVIAAKDYNFALSTTQNTNNRGQAEIIKKYNTITFGADVQTLSLVGLQDNKFALYTGSGYLYAASSSNNYLKTKDTPDNNCYWSIGISETVASIYAQGDKSHDQIKYNHQQNGQLFSCYERSNTSMSAVVIYKEVCVQDQYNVNEPKLTNATAANTNPTTVDADATSLSLKYSAADGHLLPETITVKMGGATLASGTDYTWDKETGELTITVTGFYGDIDVKIVAEADPCYQFEMSEVTATSTTNSITLTWTEVAGATGYNVRLDEGELTTATGFTHTFTGLSPKKTYNWEVQAVSAICEDSKTGSTATQKETFIVSWVVGNVTSTELVEDGGSIKTTPSDPDDETLEDCGANKFMGWSEKSAGSTPQDAAYYDDLCSAEDMIEKYPSITSNKTFYAVFATASSGGGENTAQVFATSSLGNSNSVTTGFIISADAEKKEGYYQDGSGTKRYVQVMKSNVSTSMFANTPTNVTVTAKLGGGTEKNPLTNSVYAIWLDAEGNELGDAVLLTNKITAKTGSDFTANLPIANTTSAYGVRVYHQKETGYNVRYYAISLSYKYNNTTYSNYVTNCCALAPATNLTVSGTTANSATLTWTAPSSTTGIKKLQVRNAETDEVVVDEIDVNTTTTATITGLTACTSYQYYVVSVGEDCDVVSNIVTAQPFGNAKTVNYDYNGGNGSPASFTTNCTNQTITLPDATRTGYDFNGWYTAVTGGTRVGDAGETYEPATSPVTLYAQWTIQSYTVTWNPNGGKWGESTDNIVQPYEYGAAINKPADPTRENGIFKGWNPSVPSNMPAGNQTYTAQWEMVYTLTFVDMNAGGTTTTLTQTSSGQNIVAPTANSEVCDMWTFIGWAPSNSLNGDTDKPTGFIAAGETILGSQITGNKTYYSVYSYNSDNTQEFEVGKSGTYLMYALSSGTKYYATTAKTGGFYGNPETSFATYGPSKFTLTYNKTEEKYIIYHENTTSGRESNGYFELNTLDGNVDVESETPSLFTIQAGLNGAFIIRTDYSNKVRSFGYDDSFTDYSGDNPVYFEPASEIQYYNAANCGVVETYTMSFHNPFGDENALIWYDAEHEESYYTDKPLNTSIDVFPTMVYNGWTFIGWTANQQYNDLIGEENLDDENSATDDPASSFTIYSNTAGWAYTLNDNVTMYPVFTKYEDNEDVDLSSGGEYYMYFYRDASYYEDEYFGADNHYQRMYASSVALNSGAFTYTTLCNNAQIFEFIKKGDGWNIRLKNADGTYPAKSYLVNTIENDYAVQSAEPSETWGVSKNPGGDYLMWYRGNSNNTDENNPHYRAKARELGGTSWSFKCYNKDNDASNFYYEVYLGTCENRVFSSNPSNKPIIQLSGDVYVTATNARGVMATSTLKVSAKQLNANEQVNITSNSNDVYFSADCTVNFVKANKPTNTLTITASPSGVIEQDIYVHYKPSAEGNGTPASVVVSANLATPNPSVTDDQTIYVRNLPAKFVIATKVGTNWYALPANMSNATNPEGVLIEVDETTMTTIAPNTTTYTLWPVKTTATENDRYTNVTGAAYGDRVRFAAVNYEQRGLWANNNNNGSTIRNFAVIDALGDDGLAGYEWKITTTVVDGHWQYTLQTDQTQNQNYLRYWTAASGAPKWGTYAAGNNQLYFLPVTEAEPFDYKVVEWYPTKMLIQTDATIANPTAEIGDAQINNVTCTNKGSKLYEIAGLPLESNPTKVLTIKFSDGGNNYTNATAIPVIISQSETTVSSVPFTTLTKDVYNYADLVVRDGATLTVDGGTHAENTFFNVTIYPTSKISVPEGKKLTVHSLTFFGGIDEIYNGSTYTLNKYGVPELSLKGTLYKSIAKMDYVMRVDLDQMYSLTVPYDVQLADIKYWDGSDIALGSALYVSAYDGEARANQSKKTWIYETDFNPATLKAGVGYTISAELQAGVGNEYSILRMPMNSNIANDATEAAKTVAVTAWGKDANVTDNHKGWNLVGNPYMTTITGADDDDLVLGYLQETGSGPWEWVNDGIRYVTIPADNGKDYSQQKFTDADLPPFKNFFVQIGTTGELVFDLGTRQSMPARSTQAAIEKEVEFEILMSNDARQDNTGLLISEEYSPAYEINADLEKMMGSMSIYTIYNGYTLAYNALSPINASEWIPMGYIAPAAGEYTFRLDDIDKIVEQVEHVYLIDYEANNIVDLMDDQYEFTTDKEQNNNRFAINIVLIQDKDNTTTGMDIIQGNNAAPIKFIHQDKMYIYNEGIIYDATGKQVTNINK